LVTQQHDNMIHSHLDGQSHPAAGAQQNDWFDRPPDSADKSVQRAFRFQVGQARYIYTHTPLTETDKDFYSLHASLSRARSASAEEHWAPNFLMQTWQLWHGCTAHRGVPSLAGGGIWHLLELQERAYLRCGKMGIAYWGNCKQTYPVISCAGNLASAKNQTRIVWPTNWDGGCAPLIPER